MSNEHPANEGSPIRGAIRTSLSTSSENLTAGENFSIFVTIQNPFEVPLICHSVSAHVPIEFVDVDQRQRDIEFIKLEDQIEELEEAGRDFGISSTTLPRRKSFLRRIFGSSIAEISINWLGGRFNITTQPQVRPAVARDIGARGTETVFAASIPLIGKLSSTIREDLKHEGNEEAAKKAWKQKLEDERVKYREALDALQASEANPRTLQPGNSTTRVLPSKQSKRLDSSQLLTSFKSRSNTKLRTLEM